MSGAGDGQYVPAERNSFYEALVADWKEPSVFRPSAGSCLWVRQSYCRGRELIR